MKYRWDKKYLYWGFTIFAVIVASLLFYFGLFHMNTLRGFIRKVFGILSPLIYGGMIAFVLNTLVRIFENKIVFKFMKKNDIKITSKKRKATRAICIFITVILFLWGIYVLMALLIPELIESVTNLINDFPSYVRTIEYWINSAFSDNEELQALFGGLFTNIETRAQDWLNTQLVPELNSFLRIFSSGLFEFLTFIMNFVIGLVISIYLLYGKENFVARGKQFMYSRFSIKTVNNNIRDLQFINKTFGNYIVGTVIDSLIIGILCYIGMLAMNMPYAVLISVIVGVTNVIPFFGPYLGAIPSAFLILIIDPLKCLYFLIFILILQQFDGNILKPKILGDTTGVSSFLVIVSIIIGGGVLGVLGMFIAVPVCAVICTIMRNRMVSRLQKKELPIKLSHYDNIDHLDSKTKKPVSESEITKNPRNAFQYESKDKESVATDEVIKDKSVVKKEEDEQKIKGK